LPVVILRIPKRTDRGSEAGEAVQGDPERRFLHDRDGKNLHHLIHVDDLVDAFFLAADHPDAIGNIFVVAGENR